MNKKTAKLLVARLDQMLASHNALTKSVENLQDHMIRLEAKVQIPLPPTSNPRNPSPTEWTTTREQVSKLATDVSTLKQDMHDMLKIDSALRNVYETERY